MYFYNYFKGISFLDLNAMIEIMVLILDGNLKHVTHIWQKLIFSIEKKLSDFINYKYYDRDTYQFKDSKQRYLEQSFCNEK